MNNKENSAFVDYGYEYSIFMNVYIWKQEGKDLDEYVRGDPLKILDFESGHQFISSFSYPVLLWCNILSQVHIMLID